MADAAVTETLAEVLLPDTKHLSGSDGLQELLQMMAASNWPGAAAAMTAANSGVDAAGNLAPHYLSLIHI